MTQSERTKADTKVFRIRRAVETDLRLIEWGDEYIRFRKVYQRVYQRMLQGKAIIWVGDYGDQKAIAQVFVQLESTHKDLSDGLRKIYLHSVRVHPTLRNQGLGARLMSFVENDLKDKGYQTIVLNVDQENKAAQRFYLGLGYTILKPDPGRWTYFDHNNELQEVEELGWRMQKWIGDIE